MATTEPSPTEPADANERLNRLVAHYQQLLANEQLHSARLKIELDMALENLASTPDAQ